MFFRIVYVLTLLQIASISRAEAMLSFTIDPDRSEIIYRSFLNNTPDSMVKISGVIDLAIDTSTDIYQRQTARLTPVNVMVDPEPVTFYFPSYLLGHEELSAGTFKLGASNDPCNEFWWSHIGGSCFSNPGRMGIFGSVEGTFDGVELVLEGSAPASLFQIYEYTIRAMLVPEPSTVAYFAVCAVAVLFSRSLFPCVSLR